MKLNSEKFEQKRTALFYNRPARCELCDGNLTYKGLGEYKCRQCEHLMYDDYGKIRNYLDEVKQADKFQIADCTGVSLKTLEMFVKEGILIEVKEDKIEKRCRTCGKLIPYGRYCIECSQKFKARLKSEFSLGEKKPDNNIRVSSKYYYIKNDDH